MKLDLFGRERVFTLLVALFAVVSGAELRSQSTPSATSPTHLRTPETPLVILPIRLGGRPTTRLSEVVALLLERKGLRHIELTDAAFAPEPGAWADALRAFAHRHAPAGGCLLYAEFDGTRETGLNELRAALADSGGELLWSVRLTPADRAFQSAAPREPMTMATLLADQLGPVFGLDARTEREAQPGKFARLMDERSGLPPRDERLEMPLRQRTFASARHTASLCVFPPRVCGQVDPGTAAGIARALCDARIGAQCGVTASVSFDLRRDPNEMRVLWDLARAFRDHLRQNPTGADYALYADFVFNSARWEQGYVHFVLCDAGGNWVIVDLQNSHHADFQAVKPGSAADCTTILIRRLQHYLGQSAPELSHQEEAGSLAPEPRLRLAAHASSP